MSEQTTSKRAEKIDLLAWLRDYAHGLRRLWWIVVLLTVLFTALFYYRVSTHYTPSFVAEATVAVEVANGGRSGNRGTAEQMGKTFPYILTSGALSDVIAADLGLNSLPCSITVSNITGTNLVTVDVRGSDPELAYRVLQSMLKNYPEVAQYVVGQTELTVIDDSGVPTDSGKTTTVRGSVRRGAGIGLGLGLLIVLLYVVSFRTVRSEKELRELMNVPCLGTLPLFRKKQRRSGKHTEINILYEAERGDYEEALRLIRTRLERQMEGKQVLMVTSSIPGEGKSTVAANLAVSFARKGKRVILVDCDLRNPSQAGIFRLRTPYPGLAPVLRGETPLEDALCEIGARGEEIALTLMPGSGEANNLIEVLGDESMGRLIDTLRERYDLIILDTPPSAMLVDAMMLLRHVDAVAYVVMGDYARRRFILQGMQELVAAGAPVAGCILNGGASKDSFGAYGGRS